MKNENVALIFAKWPKLGGCKTRIASDTTPQFALEFARACTSDLISKISGSSHYNLIFGVNTPEELKKFRKEYGLEGIVVKGSPIPIRKRKDLSYAQSQKFEYIFDHLINGQGFTRAVLIPMDVPLLTQEELIAAFAKLEENPVVLGPEFNGGVYLIGHRAPYKKGIFRDVQWSTQYSFQDLINNCGPESCDFLRKMSDFNTFTEVMKSKEVIAAQCPKVFELLKTEGYYKRELNRYVDFDDLPLNIPVVSAIVQRTRRGQREVLMQIRHKPVIDPQNSGKLELPGGLAKKYEPADVAAVREVREETGLDVEIISAGEDYSHEDSVVSYTPFLCTQQVSGDRAYSGTTFLCRIKGGKLRENLAETREPRWMNVREIADLVRNHPSRIYTLNIPALKQYIYLQETQSR